MPQRHNQAPPAGALACMATATVKRTPAAKARQPETIEDRLAAKAAAANNRDYTGQRSLGQMSREERHKFLYGDG